MALNKKRLDAVLQGNVDYKIFIDGDCVYQSRDLIAAVQQLSLLQKKHPDQDVKFEVLEAYQNEN